MNHMPVDDRDSFAITESTVEDAPACLADMPSPPCGMRCRSDCTQKMGR